MERVFCWPGSKERNGGSVGVRALAQPMRMRGDIHKKGEAGRSNGRQLYCSVMNSQLVYILVVRFKGHLFQFLKFFFMHYNCTDPQPSAA